jgi:hypothetical protein
MTEYVLVPREPTPEMLKAAAGITQKARMYRAMLAAAPQQQQAEPSRTDLGTRVVDVLEAIHGESQQQAEPALIGSDLFPSTIRLADGRDVQLGELVRRAAHGLEAAQWNLLPQKARDSAMVKALDDWQRGLTTQQQAEPVADSVKMQAMSALNLMQSIGMIEDGRHPRAVLRTFIQLAAVPRITAEQAEKIKRLLLTDDMLEAAAEAWFATRQAAADKQGVELKDVKLDFGTSFKAAWHAALDALVARETT